MKQRYYSPRHYRPVSYQDDMYNMYDFQPHQPMPMHISPFISHLQQKKGRTITVVTMNDTLTGELGDVFSDHILLRANNRDIHIPFTSILYFY